MIPHKFAEISGNETCWTARVTDGFYFLVSVDGRGAFDQAGDPELLARGAAEAKYKGSHDWWWHDGHQRLVLCVVLFRFDPH